MTTTIVHTDFCYTAKQLLDLEAYLDLLEVNYEVFDDDEEDGEPLYKAAICNAEPGILHRIYEWEERYFGEQW